MFSAKMRKAIAVFLLFVFVQSVVTPTLSYALTAGPTAPEATSFEPVDTTDMVDLKTGDFTYNIPLLEVPGPAGSYPLNLSYHAGILPGQEASWTGLGFNLNPGSISRLVNGYPDDHYSVVNVDRAFWEGGIQVTHLVGLSMGIANCATVSAGLEFAQDTYKGFGLGGYTGAGIGYGLNSNVSIGANVKFGISPYGGLNTSVGISLGISSASQEAMGSANIGLMFNSQSGISANAGVGISAFGNSLMDASISSSNSQGSLDVAGYTSGVYNSRANNVTVKSKNRQVDIPILYAVNLRLGRNYQRYWIDESELVHTFGSLYQGDSEPNFNAAFDTYDLLDTKIDMALHNDPEKVLGGSFPDYDLFTVTGQGLSGNIRPYHFQKHLFRQDKKDASDGDKVLSKSYPLTASLTDAPVEFRFVNDFSNRYEYTPGNFVVASNSVAFDFNGSPITGENGNDGYLNNHLAGSRHVEWYSNHEILHGNSTSGPIAEGFINCIADGFFREDNSQIGGFSITNASGVTYHYALPAYSFGEYMKSTNSETKQDQNGLSYNELTKPEKYAYTWFLTAVTGPDFVDRNSNGLADHGDWGYWVTFDYKKWLSDYKWRNPGEGTNRDVDGDFEFFSYGKKEIYYLEKVTTESHVAVFEKSERLDGREVANLAEGGFEPTPNGDGFIFPRPTLRLDKIKLYSYQNYSTGLVSDEYLLRSIDFGYDYSLTPGIPNSYANDSFATKQGRLTLTSLKFLGKKGADLIPPMEFFYKNAPYCKDNTPDCKDKPDVWGFYKSDYDEEFYNQTNDIIGRTTTPASALNVDVWSLNKIETALGATIDIVFESDQYDDVVLAKQQILRTKDVIDYGPGKLKLTFWEDVNLADFFNVGSSIDVDLIGSYDEDDYDTKDCNCTEPRPRIFSIESFSANVEVDEVNADFIVISNSDYYERIKNETKTFTSISDGVSFCEAVPIVTCEFTFSGANAWPDYFPAGTVSLPETTRFGGGLRVKSIALNHPSGGGRLTSYEYLGGTTSYEPFEILAPKILPEYALIGPATGTKLAYKRSVLNKLYDVIGISRSLPGPGVMYNTVKVKEINSTADGQPHELPYYSVYEFETFKKGMVDVVQDPVTKESMQGTYENVGFKDAYLRKLTLKDFSSRVGSLKKITLYNAGNNTAISETINHYLHDDLDGSFEDNLTTYKQNLNASFLNQGLTEETYTRARIMLYKKFADRPYFTQGESDFFETDERNLLACVGKLETFPTIVVGQTNRNFLTGSESRTENKSFDFYSGEATSVLSSDSYGNQYLSVTIPAYKKYPEMDSKVYNKLNNNMLSQTTANESYLLDVQGEKSGLLSASIQTWSKDVPVLNGQGNQSIWRKQAAYLWNGTEDLNNDGSYPIEDFNQNPFNWTTPENSEKWQKAGAITLYDVYTHGLESVDINENYSSTLMDASQTKVIASTANARYNETAFSGAEFSAVGSVLDGNVNRAQGVQSAAYSHTGKYSLLVASGSKGFNYTLSSTSAPTRKYKASVWVHAPGYSETQAELDKVELYYSVNETEHKAHPKLQKNKSKSWYLLEIDIDPAGSNQVYVGVRNNSLRGVYFDDFRLHPLDASMSSFVYDEFSGELTYMLDSKNLYTKFEYDAMGRLVRTSKELLNFDFGDGKESFRADAVLKEVKYNYGKNHE